MPSTRQSKLLPTKQCHLALFAGFACFLPVGLSYLSLIVLGLSTLHNFKYRVANSAAYREVWRAIGLYSMCALASVVYILLIDKWLPTSGSRVFHSLRTPLLLSIGLLLLPSERAAALRGFMLGALTCATIYVVNAVLPLPDFVLWHNMLTVTGNASSQKMVLLSCAAAVAFYAYRSSGRSFDATIFVGLSAIVLLLGVSRNAHLLILLLPIAVVASTTRRPHKLVITAGAGLAMLCFVYFASATFSNRVDAAASEVLAYAEAGVCDGSVSVRLAMVSAAMVEFFNQPVWGTGLGSWQSIWPTHSVACPSLAGINNPHNDYALAAIETGLIGLCTMLWLYLQLFRAALSQSAPSGISFIFIAALSISGLVNGPLRDAALGMAMIWLCTATLGLRETQILMRRDSEP